MTDEPLARLPEQITLTRDEAAVILFGLDVVEQADVDEDEATKVTRAGSSAEREVVARSRRPSRRR